MRNLIKEGVACVSPFSRYPFVFVSRLQGLPLMEICEKLDLSSG